MKVGVVGPNDKDDFASNIVEGLHEIDVEAVALGPPLLAVKSRRLRAIMYTLYRDPRLGPRLEASLLSRIREQGVDLVITVVSLRPETVRAIRDHGTSIVLWFPDSVANLGALWMFDAPYNGLFFKEPALVRRLNAVLDLPVHYLPQGCNPKIHLPVEKLPEAAGKVVVVGNLYPTRTRLLERLASEGIPLAIYGPPLQARAQRSLAQFHVGRYVRGLEKSGIFGGAAAVLNTLHPSEMEGMNSRIFESTAAAGTVVSEYRPTLETYFDLDAEILTYDSYSSLIERLESVLSDPDWAATFGHAASLRSLAEHTYSKRLPDLLSRAT